MSKKELEPDRHKITSLVLVMLEKALALKVKTPFEEKLLTDRLNGLSQFGLLCVVSNKQIEVIQDMAVRYDKAYLMTLKEEL